MESNPMEYEKPIFRKIAFLNQLPTLPGILLKLINVCNDESASLRDAADVVENDPALGSRILRLVNSAQYGLSYRVENMHQAVALLGMGTIRNLALCASVSQVFRSRPAQDAMFDLKGFWGHSLRSALLSRGLAELLDYPRTEEAFLCGLFHDIGKLVLWVHFGKTYASLMEEGVARDEAFLAAEVRLGATHPEVGAWLLRRWNLPSFMADAVFYHHEPPARVRDSLPLVGIVYAANLLSRMDSNSISRGGEEGDGAPGLRKVLRVVDLSQDQLVNLVDRVDREFHTAARALQIDVDEPVHKAEEASEAESWRRPPARREEEPSREERKALLREVRDISLIQGTMENLVSARDRDSMLRSLNQGIQILLDSDRGLFFLLDKDRSALSCDLPPGRTEGVFPPASIRLPYPHSGSILVAAVQEGRVKDSFELEDAFPEDRSILDEQIARYLDADGLLCVPMRASGEPVGVLVLGMTAHERSAVLARKNVLKMVAQNASLALQAEDLRRRRYEEIQSERLNAAYTLARKVCHEVNSPLSIIKNYLQVLSMKLEDDGEAVQDEIRIINEEIDRVSSILDKLSGLSTEERPAAQSGEGGGVDINEVVSDLARIMGDALAERSGVELHTDLDSSLPPAPVGKSDLKQVLINLIRNATEAMRTGGAVTIRTRGWGQDAEPSGAPSYAEIEVSDNGPGIPEEIRSRLFEPFVGTKGGGHSGLGLSIVYSLVESMGGRVSCEENQQGGTTFRILLPLSK
ncbi:MAG: HDOD domain-containing protein, partial [Desulfobacteraceae bacterium]